MVVYLRQIVYITFDYLKINTKGIYYLAYQIFFANFL